MREYRQEAARWNGDERRREQNMLFDLLAQQNFLDVHLVTAL